MILTENRNILSQRFPRVWETLQNIRNDGARLEEVKIEESRSKLPTLTIAKDGKTFFIHSGYNPLEEAQRLVERYQDAPNYKYVFFYGVGLGYHIEAFLTAFPDHKAILYEPVPEIMVQFLNTPGLTDFQTRIDHIYLETSIYDAIQYLYEFIASLKEEVLIVALPSYQRIFPEKYRIFQKLLKDFAAFKQIDLCTNKTFQKLWSINSLHNFGRIWDSPNIIIDMKEIFKGKPALLVAAGPSLEDEFANLKYIKENGLAYIFAVGSATKALINHDIYPDAVCAYDPQDITIDAFTEIIDNQIDSIPLIFGSSVGYSLAQAYPGPVLHMITSQDAIGKYYLQTGDGKKPEVIEDSFTIATVTLQLLYLLGCSPVVLVGQNFAYRHNRYYAKGIEYQYFSADLTPGIRKDAFLVEDVDGGQVTTVNSLNKMKVEMESYLARFGNWEVINSTKGGAKIGDTKYVSLAKLMNERLNRPVVEKGWYLKETPSYDWDYIRTQHQKIELDLVKIELILKKAELLAQKTFLEEADDLPVGQMLTELNGYLEKIQGNLFFQVFLKPMLRVELEIASRKINQFEMNAPNKPMLEVLSSLALGLGNTFNSIKPLYDEFQAWIKKQYPGVRIQ